MNSSSSGNILDDYYSDSESTEI
jgi:hypothetical protein